jgi:hypothetical protein
MAKAARKRSHQQAVLNNLVVVSDIHAGCRLALCPPGGVPLDDGGTYHPSPLQLKMWAMWREFWDVFVPRATRKEPFGVVINGDVVDGVHHNSTTQISHNLMDQATIAQMILAPVAKACQGRLWMVRGTEAHVGQSAATEEGIAKAIGAIPNAEGQCARWDLWKSIGPGKLVHFLHHIGTTGSQAYEATAVHKELVEEFVEAARWHRDAPSIIVRSHRHRYIEDTIATGSSTGETCRAIAVVTPGWQAKTPFAWKIPGARLSTPQFGGLVLRWVDDDRQIFVVPRIWTVDRSPVE